MQSISEFPGFVRALPEIDLPFPGARGWLLQGEGQQVVFVEFDDETAVPEHSHDDQWEFPLSGVVRLKAPWGDSEFVPGDNFFVPAGKPHSAVVTAGYRAMIVFDSPNRYRPKSR